MGFYDFSLNFSHVGDKIPVASENASSSRLLTRSAKSILMDKEKAWSEHKLLETTV